jgi:hypothetical protein
MRDTLRVGVLSLVVASAGQLHRFSGAPVAAIWRDIERMSDIIASEGGRALRGETV